VHHLDVVEVGRQGGQLIGRHGVQLGRGRHAWTGVPTRVRAGVLL
jgi:hypothetical protein